MHPVVGGAPVSVSSVLSDEFREETGLNRICAVCGNRIGLHIAVSLDESPSMLRCPPPTAETVANAAEQVKQ